MKLSRLQKLKNDQSGYTLIEILIAITIFAIGMLAVANMQILGIKGNATARVVTGASAWASDRIERIISLPYDHADLAPGGHPAITPDPQGRYTLSWQVTENTPINNVKMIAVTIAWQDRGSNRSLTYNYYKADI